MEVGAPLAAKMHKEILIKHFFITQGGHPHEVLVACICGLLVGGQHGGVKKCKVDVMDKIIQVFTNDICRDEVAIDGACHDQDW